MFLRALSDWMSFVWIDVVRPHRRPGSWCLPPLYIPKITVPYRGPPPSCSSGFDGEINNIAKRMPFSNLFCYQGVMKNGTMEQGKSVHNNPQTFQKVDAHSQRNLIRFRKDGDETVSFRTAPKYSVSQIRLHSSAAAGGRPPERAARERTARPLSDSLRPARRTASTPAPCSVVLRGLTAHPLRLGCRPFRGQAPHASFVALLATRGTLLIFSANTPGVSPPSSVARLAGAAHRRSRCVKLFTRRYTSGPGKWGILRKLCRKEHPSVFFGGRGGGSLFIGVRGIAPKCHGSVFVAEGAMVIGDVEIGEDSSVWFHPVLRGGIHRIRIGKRTNVQDHCTLHVTGKDPLTVGDEVTIGHGAVVHGCTVEDFCLIGSGAVVLDGWV